MVWETLLFKKFSIPETGLCYRTLQLFGAVRLQTASCSALGASHTARPLPFGNSAGGCLTPTPCWPRSSGAPDAPRHRKLYQLPQWGALPGAFRLPSNFREAHEALSLGVGCSMDLTNLPFT